MRPFTRIAALAAIALSIAYLIGGTLLTPHLWGDPEVAAPTIDLPPAPAPAEPTTPDPGLPPDVPPVILAEPEPPEADPLASIRDEMAGSGKVTSSRSSSPLSPARPPAPPGPVATGAIQVTGYLLGWASVGIALPYGLARALWLWLNGRDLKVIGREE